jgi:hypothetical protein
MAKVITTACRLVHHRHLYHGVSERPKEAEMHRFNQPHTPDFIDLFHIPAYGLYLLECLQVAIATRDAFETLGAGWGNLEALNNPQLIWFETPVMSGFSEFQFSIVAISNVEHAASFCLCTVIFRLADLPSQ